MLINFFHAIKHLAKLLLMIDSFNCLFIDTSAICNRNSKVIETGFIPNLLKLESHIENKFFKRGVDLSSKQVLKNAY